jgi:hypothetical protein
MSTDAVDNDSDLENAAERTADRTGDAAERAADKTKDVAEDAKDGAGNVWDETSDAVERMIPGDSDNDGN